MKYKRFHLIENSFNMLTALLETQT